MWKKGIEIIEGEMAIDHEHLLLSIPPKFSISGVMGYLKGKSSLVIYHKFGQAKFQYRCRQVVICERCSPLVEKGYARK